MSRLDTVEGAIQFATRAHDGQVDKSGSPYILHVLRVGARLHDLGDDYVIAGLLHDVVEDTMHTLDDLRELGAHPDVVEAVDYVTRPNRHMPYVDYIERTTTSPISGWVKASDVADNMSRLKGLDQETQFRLVVKYANAIDILARKGYYAGRFM